MWGTSGTVTGGGHGWDKALTGLASHRIGPDLCGTLSAGGALAPLAIHQVSSEALVETRLSAAVLAPRSLPGGDATSVPGRETSLPLRVMASRTVGVGVGSAPGFGFAPIDVTRRICST